MDLLYRVSGCSMMPTLADGDVIEVVSRQWQDGDIVIARVGSRTVVKRVVGDKLVGDNKNVSARFNVSDVKILGRIRKNLYYFGNDHLLRAEAADSWSPLWFTEVTNTSVKVNWNQADLIAEVPFINDISLWRGGEIVFKFGDPFLYSSFTDTGLSPSKKYNYKLVGYHTTPGSSILKGSTPTASITLNSIPVLSILTPATNQSFSAVSGRKTITLSGTVRDADNNDVIISAAINGKTKSTIISGTSTEKSWSLTWDVAADNISQGTYSNIVVTADDGNGGTATATMSYTLTVDRTVPVINLSEVANGQTYQNSVPPTFSATDAGGSGLASVTATLNGSAYTSGTAITTGGSKTLVVTAVDKAGNQAQQTVNFTVNKAPSMVLFSPAANQTLAEGQAVSVAGDRFTLRVTPSDADAGDTLQYKMIQGGVTKVDWAACTGGTAFEYTFTGLLLGNNVCQVLVKDNKGGQAVRTFTLRNKASGSSSAALSQKGVREVLGALGYPGTDFGCLNDLKPGGYSGPLSLSGILNQVE